MSGRIEGLLCAAELALRQRSGHARAASITPFSQKTRPDMLCGLTGETVMRRWILAGSAALALAWSGGPALAFQQVIGGKAGACSQAARQGRADDAALDLCGQALAGEALNSHDLAGTYVNRGAIHLLRRENALAHADFQAALKVQPGMGEAMIGEGGYLISQERWAEAEASISRGLEAGTEEPEKGYYFRAVARWAQDDFKGAYFDFLKASELKPGWDLPRRELAHFTVTPAGQG